jgi:hypothetical protein
VANRYGLAGAGGFSPEVSTLVSVVVFVSPLGVVVVVSVFLLAVCVSQPTVIRPRNAAAIRAREVLITVLQKVESIAGKTPRYLIDPASEAFIPGAA